MNKKTLTLGCLIMLIGCVAYTQVQTPFTERFSRSLEGGVTMIANNMLSLDATQPYDGQGDNHDGPSVFVDIDNDPTTFNSSSANFANPSVTAPCISVLRAFLYWSAATNGDNLPNWNFSDIKLMMPGQNAYTTISADDVIYDGTNSFLSNRPYVCFKDLTAEVTALGANIYGAYQVANVVAAEGNGGNTGVSGGWQIVFIYESPELPAKNITLFDGYAHIQAFGGNSEVDIDFNGFITVPAGQVNGDVIFGALEGDRTLQGDNLQIMDVAGNFVDLVAPLRANTNFFNSRITVGPNDFLDRNPASTNTLGFDAAVFELNNPGNTILDNASTATTLKITSNAETYGMYLLGLAVEVYRPNLDPMLITQVSGTNPTNPGDVVGFNFNFENAGNDNAINVSLSSILPPQITFVTPVTLPPGITHTYDIVTNELVFNVADGILDVGDPALDIGIEFLINDECYFLETDCDLDFEIVFEASFNGETNPNDPLISISTIDPDTCISTPVLININQPTVGWATGPNDLDVTLSCEDATGIAAAQALFPVTDKCTFVLNETSGPFVPDPTCPSAGTYENTWNFTDACGVTIADYVQTITIVDTTLPTATDPPTLDVQCLVDVPTEDPNVVTDEADNCSIPVVAFVEETVNGTACPIEIIRTYSVTDACGNTINVTQTINVMDDIAPTASNPPTLSFQCLEDVPAEDVNVVTDAADNCSVPVVAFVDETVNGTTCPIEIIRTYSVTDDCGNTMNVTQTINVMDDIAPTASNPPTLNFQCLEDVPVEDVNVVTDAADNCSVPVVAFVEETVSGTTCPIEIIRTYSVTDECGNTMNVTQTINVVDDIAPTGSNPPTLSFQCLEDVPAEDVNVVTDEADNCSVPMVAFVEETVSGTTCPIEIIRTYSVTDECGNTMNVTQTINVVDDIAPTASNPPALSFQCMEDVPVEDVNVVTDEADNCSVPVVAFVEETVNGATCPIEIIRTYSVTDECGNAINVTQTINVNDDIAPTASNPPALSFQCLEDVPTEDVNVVMDEADNCSVPVVAFVSETSNGTCPIEIVRTYSVTDECGNAINVTQTINVNDDIAPTASNPPALSFQCLEDVPTEDVNVVMDEADNCSVPVVAFVSETSNGTCPIEIVRTYSVTDECGNTMNVTQTINVVDDIAPTASNPPTLSFQCMEDVPTEDVNVVTDEADNCSVPVVAFVSETSNGTCPIEIVRTYSVTDECGNTMNVTQTINVNDDIVPTASNPSTLSFQCLEDVPAEDVNVVTDEADNCSVPVVAFVSETANGTCPIEIVRTYSVTDECGNTMNVTQTINVNDTIAPTASNPETIRVQCIADVPIQDPSVIADASDNCSVPTVTFVSDVSDNQTCPETITRTYRVSDDCNNSIDVIQTIEIDDDIAPELDTPFPLDVTVSCEEIPEVATLQFIDNCSSNVNVDFEETTSDLNDQEYTIIRTWSVTDDCGNVSVFTQNIFVEVLNLNDVREIILCVDAESIDLDTFIANTTDLTGEWETLDPDVLNGSSIDPENMQVGDYEFVYTHTTDAGCVYKTTVYAEIHDECIQCEKVLADGIDISKLVTPNNDGVNDFLEIKYDIRNIDARLCTFSISLDIYNRWGTKVYANANYDDSWKGESPATAVGDSDILPTGTYYYIVRFNDTGEEIDPIQGYILLGSN